MTYIVLAYDENFGNGSPEMSHFNSAIVGVFANRDDAEQARNAVEADYQFLTDLFHQVRSKIETTTGKAYNIQTLIAEWRPTITEKESELSKYARRVFATDRNSFPLFRGNGSSMTFEILEQE